MNAKVFLLSGLLLLAVACSPVMAGFEWKVAPNPMDIIEIKFLNYEGVIDKDGSAGGGYLKVPDSVGDELVGIFMVTTIKRGATILWSDDWIGDNTQHLVGYFKGYTASSIPSQPWPPSVPSATWEFTGGELYLFYSDYNLPENVPFNPEFSLNDGGALGHGEGYDGAVAGRNMPLVLKATGIPGILEGSNTTLFSTLTNATVPSGNGYGLLDFVGGAWQGWFAADAFDAPPPTTGEQDAHLQSTIGEDNYYGWPAASEDPIKAQIIPEPASLIAWTVLGVCALGFAAVRRRK
jgi:hypothetical protein